MFQQFVEANAGTKRLRAVASAGEENKNDAEAARQAIMQASRTSWVPECCNHHTHSGHTGEHFLQVLILKHGALFCVCLQREAKRSDGLQVLKRSIHVIHSFPPLLLCVRDCPNPLIVFACDAPYSDPVVNVSSSGYQPATYYSGNGTAHLVFLYTVQPGDHSKDLEYWDEDAFNTDGFIRRATDEVK